MQQNIGLLDRYVRLVGGLVAYASAARLKKTSVGQAAMLTFGAMKIAEGVTGWCPLMYACGIQTTGSSSKPNQQHNAQNTEDSNEQTKARHSSEQHHNQSQSSGNRDGQKNASANGDTKSAKGQRSAPQTESAAHQ